MLTSLPYGSWPSPITAEDLAVAGVRLGGPRYDGDDLYWTQSRPTEGGRTALLRERDGVVMEVVPGVNVRTRVHEYGGGAWDARDGVVVVSSDPSGQLLRVDGDKPRPLTPEGMGWRFADLRVHPELGVVLAIREDHPVPGAPVEGGGSGEPVERGESGEPEASGGPGEPVDHDGPSGPVDHVGSVEPVNTLVVLRLDRPNDDGGSVIAAGADFYASPELSRDGRLAWMEWRHPDMPWDACLVRVGHLSVSASGAAVDDVRTVAGGPGESAVHPLWRGRDLLFCSDRSGFWELYAAADPTASLAPPVSSLPTPSSVPSSSSSLPTPSSVLSPSSVPSLSSSLPTQSSVLFPSSVPTPPSRRTPGSLPGGSSARVGNAAPAPSRRGQGAQDEDQLTQLTDGGVDLVEPFWVFGRRPYAVTGDGSIVVRPRIDGRSAPMLLVDGGYDDLGSDAVDCDSLDAAGDRIVALVQFPHAPDAIIERRDSRWRIVDAAAPTKLGPEWVSTAEQITWPGPAGKVHGWFYPPVNPLVEGSSAGVDESSSAEPGDPSAIELVGTPDAGAPLISTSSISGADSSLVELVETPAGASSISTSSISDGVRSAGSPPLIVISHGGPTAFSTAGFNAGIQFWTTRGFAVLDVNYSGSSGYGRAYRDRLRGEWGVLDVADCIAGAEALAQAARVDGHRIAIRGGSAGGYTTLRALTTSNIFAAGCSRYGIGDLAALASDTHKFEARYLDGLIGPWPAASELYAERSPINHVDALNCPMLLLQGAEDAVVPPSQAETMAAAVAAKGLDVELIIFEGEGHGFRKAETIRDALDAELAFYARTFGIPLPESQAGLSPRTTSWLE